MLIRFVKKFSKYSAIVIAYGATYGILSYTLGLIAPWLFPVLTLVGFVGFFAYCAAKDQANAEQHALDEADRQATHERLMEQLRKGTRAPAA